LRYGAFGESALSSPTAFFISRLKVVLSLSVAFTNEISTIQPHDDERIKQIEANGRDNEQLHGGDDLRGMITQKGAPSLALETAPLDHVFGDARLPKPELEQFAVNVAIPMARSNHGG